VGLVECGASANPASGSGVHLNQTEIKLSKREVYLSRKFVVLLTGFRKIFGKTAGYFICFFGILVTI
jgi:hypothetical protein